MTIERFVKELFLPGITVTNLGNISNKTLSKVLKQYKYIDVREYWYDDQYKPEELVWVDVEGMGYGWMWLNYRNSDKKLRKALRKFALGLHNKEPVWTYQYEEMKRYLFELDNSIVEIQLSNNRLEPW